MPRQTEDQFLRIIHCKAFLQNHSMLPHHKLSLDYVYTRSKLHEKSTMNVFSLQSRVRGTMQTLNFGVMITFLFNNCTFCVSVSLSYLYQFSIYHSERGLENFCVCVCISLFMCSRGKKKGEEERNEVRESGQCGKASTPGVPINVI